MTIVFYALGPLLLVVGVEFLIIFAGTVFGPVSISDWPKLLQSPVFHGISILIVLGMFLPWKKWGARLGL